MDREMPITPHAPAGTSVVRASPQQLWERRCAEGATCPRDGGPLALTVCPIGPKRNLYALRCVGCGWASPPFIVVGKTVLRM